MTTLAFTGTREGLTAAQRAALSSVEAPRKVLHGGAVGADSEFHAFVLSQTIPYGVIIEVWPCDPTRAEFWKRQKDGVFYSGRDYVVHPIEAPLIRNRLMVERCSRLLACPATAHEVLRSGTWATVRAARKLGKPVTIVGPDGSVREEP